MTCDKCKTKMERIKLKFTTYVGNYKHAYVCPKCEKDKK